MTAAPAHDRRRKGGLWHHRDFRLLWIGESTSQVGTAVTSIVLPLVAIDVLHASTFLVSILAACLWAPWLVLGLPAGAWIDRLPRRPVMLACDAVSLLGFLSVPVAGWLGVLTAGQLVAVALIGGGSSVFFSTAYDVYLPSLIDPVDLTEGNAKLTGSRSAAQIAGPGIGGVLAGTAGAATGLLADAVSFAVSLLCLTLIRSREQPVGPHRAGRRHLAGEVKDGLRFVAADPFLRPQLLFAAAGNLFLTGLDALLVLFLVRTLGLASGIVGALVAAGGVGGIAGAVVARPLARRWGTCRAVVIVVTGGLPWALLLPLTAPGAGLIFFVGASFAFGAAVVAANVIIAAFRQTYVPAGMLGRVTACAMTVSFSAMPAGALIAGGLGQAIGVRNALWILCAGIAASALIFLASRMRHVRDFPDTPDRAVAASATSSSAP